MSNTRKPRGGLSIDDLIAEAKPLTRTAHVCTRGDLQAEYDEAEHDLREAERGARGVRTNDMADEALGELGEFEAEIATIRRRLDAIRIEMREHVRPFRFRSIKGGSKAYTALEARFRSGPGAQMDQNGEPMIGADGEPVLDLNVEEFAPVLIAACAAEPKMSQAQAKAFLQALNSEAVMVELVTTAQAACLGQIDVPFSRDDSRKATASTSGKGSRALRAVESPQPSGLDESSSPEPSTSTSGSAQSIG